MIIKTFYKLDLTSTNIIEGNKNVLSFNTKTKKIKNNDYLQITEFGWGFIWLLIKTKLNGYRIFLCITQFLHQDEANERVDFFKLKQAQIDKNLNPIKYFKKKKRVK